LTEIIVPQDFLTAKLPKLPKPEPTEEELAEMEKNAKNKKKQGKKEEQKEEEEEDDEDVVEPESEEYYAFLFANFKNWEPATKYIEMGEEGEAVEVELETPLHEGHIVLDYG
jgi:hypothetical protein